MAQTSKKRAKPSSAKPLLRIVKAAGRSQPPTYPQVRMELLSLWDADSPLNIAQLNSACDAGVKLGQVGITVRDAESYINKYNSIIYRAPGRGPLVSGSEAIKFLNAKMNDIIQEVTRRAQP